jgi:hypothetical protein
VIVGLAPAAQRRRGAAAMSDYSAMINRHIYASEE